MAKSTLNEGLVGCVGFWARSKVGGAGRSKVGGAGRGKVGGAGRSKVGGARLCAIFHIMSVATGKCILAM